MKEKGGEIPKTCHYKKKKREKTEPGGSSISQAIQGREKSSKNTGLQKEGGKGKKQHRKNPQTI